MITMDKYLSLMEGTKNNITTAKELYKLMQHKGDDYIIWFDALITKSELLIQDIDYKLLVSTEEHVNKYMELGELDCLLSEHAMLTILSTSRNEDDVRIYQYIRRKQITRDMNIMDYAKHARAQINDLSAKVEDLTTTLVRSWVLSQTLMDSVATGDVQKDRNYLSVKTFMQQNWLKSKDKNEVEQAQMLLREFCGRTNIKHKSSPRVEDGVERYPTYVLRSLLVHLPEVIKEHHAYEERLKMEDESECRKKADTGEREPIRMNDEEGETYDERHREDIY